MSLTYSVPNDKAAEAQAVSAAVEAFVKKGGKVEVITEPTPLRKTPVSSTPIKRRKEKKKPAVDVEDE